jgi:hypothetical protein
MHHIITDTTNKDWANPYVQKFIHVYPEITNWISESWQAGKYINDILEAQLTPMWADWVDLLEKHFYVREVAQIQDCRFVLPLCFVVYEEQDYVEANVLSQTEVSIHYASSCISTHQIQSRQLTLYNPVIVCILCLHLEYNYQDLVFQRINMEFEGEKCVLIHQILVEQGFS